MPVITLYLVNLLTIEKILVNNKNQKFRHNNDLITINLEEKLEPGEIFVKIFYGGKPGVAARPPWEGGFSWEKDSNGNQYVMKSQYYKKNQNFIIK